MALSVFKRCTELAPHREESWNSLGMTYQECGQYQKAKECFKKAIEKNPKADYLGNLAVAYLTEGNHPEAKRWCRKALEKEPEHAGSWTTYGLASLATGDFANGWKGYEYCLGGKFRKELFFGDAKRWEGSPVDSLVVYGEQGLGDEIMYASCLPDAQRLAKRVTLECDRRLERLFQRSFPEIAVHGTRREEGAEWRDEPFDARCASGSLAALFRPNAESFPKKPYLKADPERRLMWRSLFDSFKKPVIGLAWTGGRPNTHAKDRAVGLESFRNYITKTDAVFVSLQYKDAEAEIEDSLLPVRQFRHATLTQDYDDTAAMVAELDLVLGVHTTVHHLAGALGTPSKVLVPSKPMWNYAHGDGFAWYPVPFHRQKPGESWADCINRL